MEISIDTRENGERKHENARKERAMKYYTSKGHTTSITQLETGDYVFKENNTTVAFEYKLITDYMSSIYDNSLFEEASNQTLEYDYSYVIIEGTIEEYIKKTWTQWRIRSKYKGRYDKFYTKTLSVYYGSLRRLRKFTCPIECKSEQHCFMEMLEQSKKCFDNKNYAGTKRHVQSKNRVEYFLSGANGVSSKLISNITETLELNNLEDLLKLTVTDLTSVPLIGPKKADKIYEWINGDVE